MPDLSFALFETAVGCCAIVWSARGVAGVQLPEASAAATRARVVRRYPSAAETPPSPEVSQAIDGITALLRGEARDLTGVPIDNAGVPEFNARVYAIARTIPPGATMTYGEIAERLGDKALAREVGTALGQNPCPIIMPCQDRRLLRPGRRGHETAPADDRRRAAGRPHAVRSFAAGRPAPPLMKPRAAARLMLMAFT
jgi:methylated-DNA-[protein]-cysteine S-methyltransferase